MKCSVWCAVHSSQAFPSHGFPLVGMGPGGSWHSRQCWRPWQRCIALMFVVLSALGLGAKELSDALCPADQARGALDFDFLSFASPSGERQPWAQVLQSLSETAVVRAALLPSEVVIRSFPLKLFSIGCRWSPPEIWPQVCDASIAALPDHIQLLKSGYSFILATRAWPAAIVLEAVCFTLLPCVLWQV